jgi:hypothetical protein
MRKSKAPGDRRFCDFDYIAGACRVRWCAGYADYADFIGFGTEAFFLNTLVPAEQFGTKNSYLLRRILHIFRHRRDDNRILRPCEITSSQKSCSLRDEIVFRFSFCTEFLDARAATKTIYTVLPFFCGRYFSKNIILYLNPTQINQKTKRNINSGIRHEPQPSPRKRVKN